MFPDRSPVTQADWCGCCFAHDQAYWRGGTQQQRRAADDALRDCVIHTTGNAALAQIMHAGVRSGGSPYFINGYRWGYGWGYGRNYAPLSAAENARADQLLAEYFQVGDARVCQQGAAP